MNSPWDKQIKARVPDWTTYEYWRRWNDFLSSDRRCYVGDVVSGEVIALAPFGVWVFVECGHPIDEGFPGLLRKSDMLKNEGNKKLTVKDFPQIGETVHAEINFFEPTGPTLLQINSDV